ncbi:hypothetical protein BDW75DRAFT_239804 [Aspergillus navahoensis]
MVPSLLDYALFHGIARDYTAVDQLTHIDDTLKLDRKAESLPQHLESGARFLTSLIREAQAEKAAVNFHRFDNAKIEQPTCGVRSM